jgi:hypothetical protein
MKLSESDKQKIRDDLMDSKNAAMRALNKVQPHSTRLTRKLEKICAELEAAQGTALSMRVTESESAS